MKPQFKQIVIVILSIFLLSCNSDETPADKPVVKNPVTPVPPVKPISGTIHYLALGDSYTIGHSVCETCRFPEQLKASLQQTYSSNFSLQIIAKTGWTTTNLLSAIKDQNPEPNYDLVTLLIGVNNQYQGRDFSLYEKEFPQLAEKAVLLAKGDKKNVIVISIPDYAYTPYGNAVAGNERTRISAEIDKYNAFAEKYCTNNGITFVSITDITRMGLDNKDLVASDGLHPSQLAYSKFVDRMMPKVKKALED
ncbi:SGNH/GDSL hydrolase family protein [Flavobacterium gelatinilyticum]|uniref:SGNH/GDSL hydrolase family protein n=1 Tax=Flavobacterium gelatinilyticum TaxID=3003260 RepID=UPI00248092D3|nr:SGNH/GDSL hydrolase family protein [Flavobacterium gelatinilyticum]